jgi:N-acetylglucosaminyldiphosphoundecaprenol N-acetyl-beta-D-mannosaminyltransferase
MRIHNTRFDNLTFSEALEKALSLLDGPSKGNLFFLNIDCLYKATRDLEYQTILNSAELVLPDGVGLSLSARLWGGRLRENCCGTDFCPELLRRAADGGYRVFLLGGLEGVAQRAAETFKTTYPKLQIVGTQNGYFQSDQAVIERINGSGADILLVAMGAPLQEKWIARNRDRLHPRLCLGVGALLDNWSGRIRRAPALVRKLRIEWLWRIFMEPGRLWKRYLVDDATFLVYLVKKRLSVERPRPAAF